MSERARVRRPRRSRASRQRSTSAGRDQNESAFTSILAGLVARVPGARAAALVDFEGETVDYAGRADPYAVRVAAAHWRIVIDVAAAQVELRPVRWLAIRAARASYLMQALPDGYAIVVVLTRAAGFVGWRRAFAACARALAREAGWSEEGLGPPWYAVEVVADHRRRPATLRIDGHPQPLEILGSLAGGLAPRERGWRVRLSTGIEGTLVREPGGAWYTDEPFDPTTSAADGAGRRTGASPGKTSREKAAARAPRESR